MKCLVRIIALMMVISIVACPVSAEEIANPASSAYFSSYTAYIERDSGSNILTIGFDVQSVGTVAKLGATRIQVLKSSNRSDWTIVATYSSDDYPSMIYNGTGAFYAYERSYTASYNYYYKIYVSFYAYKSTYNHGTLHAYSNVVYVSR